LRPVQAVTVGQVKYRAVAIREPTGGLGDQIGEFGAGGHDVRRRLSRYRVGHVVKNCFPSGLPDAAQRLMAGDGIQPRA